MGVWSTIHGEREKTGIYWSDMTYFAYSFKGQTFNNIETSQLVCFANELTSFYVMATFFFSGLSIFYYSL